ncbi:hypothetical protein ACLBXM_22560 [Xanthobacteraceae bacterium A53D]
MPTTAPRSPTGARPASRKLRALLLATALGGAIAMPGLAAAQTHPPRTPPPPVYFPPIPGQDLSPPQPRSNMVPRPPPTTRPTEGSATQRIQGGSTRPLPLPYNPP